MRSSGMLCRVGLVRTDVSEELSASETSVVTSPKTAFFIDTAVETSNLARCPLFGPERRSGQSDYSGSRPVITLWTLTARVGKPEGCGLAACTYPATLSAALELYMSMGPGELAGGNAPRELAAAAAAAACGDAGGPNPCAAAAAAA
jgi:hypothetical protein